MRVCVCVRVNLITYIKMLGGGGGGGGGGGYVLQDDKKGWING